MRARIASLKMFLNVQPLPHISCSPPSGMSRGDYGTAEHGDKERTDDGGFRALPCVDASGEGEKSDSLLHHSDQGSQYTSKQFQRLMADHGITCSMSRSGNVRDKCCDGSFFSSLKTERTARKVYRTRDDARADVFDYIERFYNPRRRHSTLGYLSPVEFEEKAMLA